jgi:alkylation response protein AidB-like acyl-CoA dehydrogenase
MFDLDTSEETNAVVDVSRALALDVLYPAARAAEKSGSVPDGVRRALFDTGLTAPVGEAFGGGGRPSCATQLAAIESLSYGDPGLTMAAAWSGAAAIVIGAIGTPSQQALLPTFATDPNCVAAVALYEGHGRSPSESSTTITRAAAGSWIVRGTKLTVAAARASDPLLVVGVDPADHRLRIAVVRTGTAGVAVADPQRHIALDAAQLSTVTFDCTLGDEAILGGLDADPGSVHLAVAHVRLLVAAAMLGTAQRANDYAAKYANERIAFGKPISAFQGVSFMLADSAIRIAAAKLEVLEVATRIDANASDEIEARTTTAVNYVGTVATQATRDAIQALGGHGFITDHPVELWYRSAAALAALDFDPLCSAFEPAL